MFQSCFDEKIKDTQTVNVAQYLGMRGAGKLPADSVAVSVQERPGIVVSTSAGTASRTDLLEGSMFSLLSVVTLPPSVTDGGLLCN